MYSHFRVALISLIFLISGCTTPATQEPEESHEVVAEAVETTTEAREINNKVDVLIDGDTVRMPASEVLGVIRVLFATNRALAAGPRMDERRCEYKFGSEREPDEDKIWYGYCDVSIPLNHIAGRVDSPQWYRYYFPDNRKKDITLTNGDVVTKKEFDKLLSKGLALDGMSFLYIHGYNVNFKDAAKRTGQMAYDLQFKGAPIFYSWPSKGRPVPYTNDEPTSEYSGSKLHRFLVEYLSRPDVKGLYIIAHSMGSRTTTTALTELYRYNPELKHKIKEVVFAAPDIDEGTFKALIAPKIAKDAPPITLYVSSRDKALIASNALHAMPRLGQLNKGKNVYTGIDTIDASALDAGFVGHSYYGDSCSILSDISVLFRNGNRAVDREGKYFEPVAGSHGKYWKLWPYTTPPVGPSYQSVCPEMN